MQPAAAPGGSRRLRGLALKTYSPNQTKTENAFVAAGGSKSKITDNWSYITNAVTKAGIPDDVHFAFFVANMMQETAALTTKKEYSSHYDASDYDWNSDQTIQYYGRGYLQTTWKTNYEAAKDTCKTDDSGNTVDVVTNPVKIESSENLAWCTAAYYWKKNVQDDRCNCDLGMTIDAINGDLECKAHKDKDTHNEEAKNRYCYFKKFYEEYSGNTVQSWNVGTACGNLFGQTC
jgi:predicted chitinase